MPALLLTIAAVLEGTAGLAFVALPGPVLALLLGSEPHVQAEMIGRLAGVALITLGIACAGAVADSGGAARTGTIGAITVYNAAAGVLLLLYAAIGWAGGTIVWAVGALHLAFAAAFVRAFRDQGIFTRRMPK